MQLQMKRPCIFYVALTSFVQYKLRTLHYLQNSLLFIFTRSKTVYVGRHHLSGDTKSEQRLLVNKVKVHPHYDS